MFKILLDSLLELYYNKKIYKIFLIAIIISLPTFFLGYNILKNVYYAVLICFLIIIIIDYTLILKDKTLSMIKDRNKTEYLSAIPLALLVSFILSLFINISTIILYIEIPVLFSVFLLSFVSLIKIIRRN